MYSIHNISWWQILKLIAIFLDILGGTLIAVAVIQETGKRVSGESLPELEKDIEHSINAETKLSIAGLFFLVFGFLLLFICELRVGLLE